VVGVCYALTCICLAYAALIQGIAVAAFWLPWLLATAGMLREAELLKRPQLPRSAYGLHFRHQVWLGGLLLLALILPQLGGPR
jgi:4-hydroxybenzoate polyprenyltransferase